MLFQDWGEERLIQYLANNFPVKGSIVGIGDDCAVIPGEPGKSWLITSDALIEGVHFLQDEILARDLGYKTIAVNVSDITAMGGEPRYAFLSIALPKKADCVWVFDLIQGVKDACEKWNLLLLGGDTVGSKRDLFLNVTLMGSAVATKIKYRSQAKPNDVVCVSRHLGDSGGGFKAMQEKVPKSEDIEYLLHAHFRPEPHPKEGMWLASQAGVHAMMDISDGLDCDLKRLIKSSQNGAMIETSKIPISPTLARVSLEKGWDSLQLALTGGEDYCLLCTVSPDTFEVIQDSFQKKFGAPLFRIGRMTSQPNQLIYNENGKPIQKDYKNFDHFQ